MPYSRGHRRRAQGGGRKLLEMLKGTVEEGTQGVSRGRNVFQLENPTKMVQAIYALVHLGATVQEALKLSQ